jgi:UDP-GlcNAc:undecaprenyl-phosphate GlcNAc-1-phosphate transferase
MQADVAAGSERTEGRDMRIFTGERAPRADPIMIDITSFWTIALLAFLSSYLALITLRPVAVSVGLVDRVGALKLHGDNVPMIGGLAILVGYCFVLAVHPVLLHANLLFLLCGTLIVVTGLLDDRFQLSPLARLSIQIAVALIAVFGAGLTVDNIGSPFLGGVVELGGFAIPFTILVFVGGINAWNMIDGIDGLASVLAFIGLGFLLAVAGWSGPALQASLLALLCSIGAFFLFNLPFRGLRRHRTFLGDAGSTFLGFAVVWHALELSQGPTAAISPLTALWFVALPVYDVITTTVRRALKGVSPLAGDRQHLHHLLQDHGLSIRQTLVVMAILALLGGLIGISSHYAGASDSLMFGLYASLGAVYFLGVRRLSRGARRTSMELA